MVNFLTSERIEKSQNEIHGKISSLKLAKLGKLLYRMQQFLILKT
jgi:hypothetical protein